MEKNELLLGTRYPTLAFITGGAGQAADGIPPQPFETFCYDSALMQAKIENFNIVPYTSVLPKELQEDENSESAADNFPKITTFHVNSDDVILLVKNSLAAFTIGFFWSALEAIAIQAVLDNLMDFTWRQPPLFSCAISSISTMCAFRSSPFSCCRKVAILSIKRSKFQYF